MKKILFSTLMLLVVSGFITNAFAEVISPQQYNNANKICGGKGFGTWYTDNIYMVVLNKHDQDRKNYRVCNFSTSSYADVEHSSYGTKNSVYPGGCVDLIKTYTIKIRPEKKGEKVFGIYCRID